MQLSEIHGAGRINNVSMDLPHKYNYFSRYDSSHIFQDTQLNAPSLVVNISSSCNKREQMVNLNGDPRE